MQPWFLRQWVKIFFSLFVIFSLLVEFILLDDKQNLGVGVFVRAKNELFLGYFYTWFMFVSIVFLTFLIKFILFCRFWIISNKWPKMQEKCQDLKNRVKSSKTGPARQLHSIKWSNLPLKSITCWARELCLFSSSTFLLPWRFPFPAKPKTRGCETKHDSVVHLYLSTVFPPLSLIHSIVIHHLQWDRFKHSREIIFEDNQEILDGFFRVFNGDSKAESRSSWE